MDKGWGALGWDDDEFLIEMDFIFWCRETGWPRLVNRWADVIFAEWSKR